MNQNKFLDDGSASELDEALAYTRLLQSISLQLIADQPIEELYECLAAAAATLLRSDFASMQMLYAERNGGELRLLAHRGFSEEAAEAWAWVPRSAASSCAAAMRTGARVIIEDVKRCEFMVGTENLAMHLRSGIRSSQSTPLFARDGQLVGMLSTHWANVHRPSTRQLVLLDILARQAADLVERRRAEDELREAHDDLEQKVVQRTGQVRELLRRLVNSQEEERRRIARDIHDQMGQQMTALRMNIELLAADPSAAQLELTQQLAETLDGSIDFLAWELRPADVDRLSLPEALTALVGEWSTRFGIPADCDVSRLEGVGFELDVASNVYRLVQEALHNVYKHAGAARVAVRAERNDRDVVIMVMDDGCGFEPDDPTTDIGTHLGFVGMHERALLIGGELSIESSPQEGTTVHLRLPRP